MTDEHLKEQLSIHYIGLLASKTRFILNKPLYDYGVDGSVELIEAYRINEDTRYTPTGKAIDFQLKCTTKKQIMLEQEGFKFDLKAKNYNDLIKRKNDVMHIIGGYTPLILILMVLPEKEQDQVVYSSDYLRVNAEAFWFFPKDEDDFTGNKSTKRIDFSFENRINLDFFPSMFNLFYKN